jgi:ferredoxin-NADP reductase
MQHLGIHRDASPENPAIRPVFNKKEISGQRTVNPTLRFVRRSWRGFDENVEVITPERTLERVGRALTELGLKIQREHLCEFRSHRRAPVRRSCRDGRQKALKRFHDDVGNEKRFLM